MRKHIIWILLTLSAIVFGSIQAIATEPVQLDAGRILVVLDRAERTKDNAVHLRVKVVNNMAVPVFLEGYSFPVQRPIIPSLQQWRTGGEWHTVIPCPDLPFSAVIVLKPGETKTEDVELTERLYATCQEKTVNFEGRFRFRLDFFLSEREAKTHEKNFFSSQFPTPRPHVAVSEVFEIPKH